MKKLFSSYWDVLGGYHRRAFLLVGLLTLAGVLEGVALVCLMPIFNTSLTGNYPHSSFFELFHLAWNPANRTTMLAASLGCFLFFGILSTLAKAGSEIGILRLRTAIEFTLRERLMVALLSMRWTHYLTLKMGEIEKAMAQEGYMIAVGVEAAIQLLGQILVSCWLILLAFGISPNITILTLLFGLITLLLTRRIMSATKKHAAAYTASSSTLANITDQYFSNLKFVKSFGLTPFANDALTAENKKYAHYFFQTYLFGPIGRLTFEGLAILFIGSIVAFAFWAAPYAFGRIIIFLSVFYRLAPRLTNLHLTYNQALSIEPWYSLWKERYLFAVQNNEPRSEGLPLASFHDLRLDGVHFSYDKRTILKDVSLELTSGKTLALVGESGGGKTTVLDLVTGLISPSKGSCRLNSVSLQDIDLNIWRSNIGLVMQNTPIFHTTVLQNIAIANPQPDLEKAEKSARMAHAWDFIERLPGKLHADLGDKGADLSQGERQRLALARALYRDPWLLILDEATSALDAESESYILDTLKRIKGSVAILMVSHRISAVDFADEVLVLGGGEILERGTYQELLGRPAGDFRRLAKLQGIVDF